MTRYEFKITVPASGGANRINLATAAIAAGAFPINSQNLFSEKYLPCCQIVATMDKGTTGIGYLGGAKVDQTGVDTALELNPGTASTAGTPQKLETSPNENTMDLASWFAHGTVPSDVINITYWQA